MAIYLPRTFPSELSPIKRAYALFGADDQGKEEAIAAIISVAIDPLFADFDSQVMDATLVPVDDILAAAAGAPFASPVRLTIVKCAEVYRKREKAGEAERLAEGIKRLPAQSCMVFRVANIEADRGRKTCLTAKLDNAISSVGTIIEFRALSEEALSDWLISEAARFGKLLDGAAAHRLSAVAPDDRIALRNELLKAVAFAGDSTRVTRDHVEAVVYHDPEDVMFKVVDAVSHRNLDLSLKLFHELLHYDNKPQSVAGRLISLLSRQLRLILQAGELSRMKVPASQLKGLPHEVADQLPSEGSIVSMAWKARDLYQLSNTWTPAQLLTGFQYLVECDAANKGGEEGVEDTVTNLELLIIKLCGMR
ncbi:MAG: DNA polymerase III subunit delta [Chthonomonadales bacterium]